jgi:hypothetical protein
MMVADEYGLEPLRRLSNLVPVETRPRIGGLMVGGDRRDQPRYFRDVRFTCGPCFNRHRRDPPVGGRRSSRERPRMRAVKTNRQRPALGANRFERGLARLFELALEPSSEALQQDAGVSRLVRTGEFPRHRA